MWNSQPAAPGTGLGPGHQYHHQQQGTTQSDYTDITLTQLEDSLPQQNSSLRQSSA
jgi:hypothetical protein